MWVSDELKGLLGVDDDEQLGYGKHILERYQLPPWRSMVTDESAAQVPGPAAVAYGTPGGVWCYSARLHDESAELFGIARVHTAGLPAHLLVLVARGDEVLFERMAQVAEPRRRATAVLFADLESSGVLSRRLSGAAFFLAEQLGSEWAAARAVARDRLRASRVSRTDHRGAAQERAAGGCGRV